MYAFLRIGFKTEAMQFMSWIQNYAAKSDRPPRSRRPWCFLSGVNSIWKKKVLSHWEGYRGSGPVRIGNGAYRQFQNDTYGELMDGTYLFNKYVSPISFDLWSSIRKRMSWICENLDPARTRESGRCVTAGNILVLFEGNELGGARPRDSTSREEVLPFGYREMAHVSGPNL